jgi:nitrogen regulatory protein P-II 1
MKLIKSIIKPFKLEEVKEALAEVGIEGMTVTEVKALVARRVTRKSTVAVNTLWTSFPKVMIEVIVDDAIADKTASAIVEAAKTGKIGDGKVFILPVESAIRIRTEESGAEAL